VRTGLSNFGAGTFYEGLVALIAGAEQAGTFNEIGGAVLYEQAIGFFGHDRQRDQPSARPRRPIRADIEAQGQLNLHNTFADATVKSEMGGAQENINAWGHYELGLRTRP